MSGNPHYLTCPEYEALKARYISGWRTWNVHSVFSYVHMPDGLALGLHMKEYRDGNFLENALIGRFPTDDVEDATEVLYPGDHAMDDSYTAMRMKWCGLELLVESAASEDAFALLITPIEKQRKPAGVYLTGGYLWNRPGSVCLMGDGDVLVAQGGAAACCAPYAQGGADACCADGAGSGAGSTADAAAAGTPAGAVWRVATSAAAMNPDRNVPLTGPYLAVLLDEPVAFYAERERAGAAAAAPAGSACNSAAAAAADGACDSATGAPAAAASATAPASRDAIFHAASALIAAQKARLDARHNAAGEYAWALKALECAVAWDTIYDANLHRVISPVSRLWSIRKGGYVLFCWDNFFAGYLAGFVGRELAYSNVIEIVNERTEKGFVPNMSCGNGQKTLDRSQPPVGARMVLELYRKFGDLWLVELLYPALLGWNTWFFENRRSRDGALMWGSDPAPVIFGNRWESDGVHDRYGGSLESGLDNSPMYDDIFFDQETNCLMLDDVGLTGMFLMDLAALKRLAQLLGRTEDLPLLDERTRVVTAGLRNLWDDENGFFYNRRTDSSAFSRRISPTNFYALFAEEIPEAHLRRVIEEHYKNPEEFYGDWMLPSIARNDPAYGDQDYWRGRVWAPMNFLTYLAFEQHGLKEACDDLAEKSAAIFLPEWEEHRHVHENYNAITGEGCDAHNSDKFYHWGALLAAIVLRNKGIS